MTSPGPRPATLATSTLLTIAILASLAACSGANRSASPAVPPNETQTAAADTPILGPRAASADAVIDADPDRAEVLETAETQPDGSDGEVFPGVVVDREARTVELAGKVCGREVDWLELLACSPGTRTYESVVSLDAPATQIHLALLLLGLEPGEPARGEWDDGQFTAFPPSGPAVDVFIVLPDRQDEPVPANEWIVSQEDGSVMQGNTWIFTGSKFIEHEGKRWFLAEQNGTLLSLVNFGDDLLSRQTGQGDERGNALWTARTDAIPPVGSPLTLRLVAQPGE